MWQEIYEHLTIDFVCERNLFCGIDDTSSCVVIFLVKMLSGEQGHFNKSWHIINWIPFLESNVDLCINFVLKICICHVQLKMQ